MPVLNDCAKWLAQNPPPIGTSITLDYHVSEQLHLVEAMMLIMFRQPRKIQISRLTYHDPSGLHVGKCTCPIDDCWQEAAHVPSCPLHVGGLNAY